MRNHDIESEGAELTDIQAPSFFLNPYVSPSTVTNFPRDVAEIFSKHPDRFTVLRPTPDNLSLLIPRIARGLDTAPVGLDLIGMLSEYGGGATCSPAIGVHISTAELVREDSFLIWSWIERGKMGAALSAILERSGDLREKLDRNSLLVAINSRPILVR